MRTLTAAIAATLLITIGGCASGAEGGSTAATRASASEVVSSEASPSPEIDEASAEEQVAFEPVNFLVDVKTTEKQCFGSAGCNVTVRLKLNYVYEPKSAFSLTVKITGDESGPIIETVDVDEDGQFDVPEISLSTPRSATKVRAKVTDVEKL